MTGTFANMLCPWFFATVLLLGLAPTSGAAPTQAATGARVGHAIAHLRAALAEAGVVASISADPAAAADIMLISGAKDVKPEHFLLQRTAGGPLFIRGGDDSGVLYGALELAARVRTAKNLPATLDVADGPELRLRGPCIGMQRLMKSKGENYLWSYTPENFPFFYDKAQWTCYLDLLLENRMNSLYLWNGHPFPSLVTLADYPEAAEVTPEVMQRNRETMHWLTSECDKRGIWLIQMFYNIHLPEGLAKKHALSTSLAKPHPTAADYTRKALAKFVEDYPSVGLLVCLGEALSGKENQVEWFTRTIIPGVQDGLKARGWPEADLANKNKLPPIVVRGHHVVEFGGHKVVLGEGIKLYPNLVSMVKFNGESLTTWEPRGKYQQFHKDMAAYSGSHLANVHLLSNLEPFRYADFSFIHNSVRAIRDRLDGNGLHLYPLAYWDWPNVPDTAPGLRQLDRDRLWFEIWARYAWKIDRDPTQERAYWIGRIARIYGTREAAEKIYDAYDAFGECAPRLLRRFGITGGNRQCLSLGMFLDQLTDPRGVWQDLYDSDSPPGETIAQFVAKEFKGEAHAGETPPQVIDEVLAFAKKAVDAIDAAAPLVTKNKEEFERLRNDVRCVEAMSKFYCAKAQAAMMVHRYRHSRENVHMLKALPLLEESLEQYKILTALTKDTYRYACGYHGRQQVPKSGVYHWTQLVGDYEKELADFRAKLANLGGGQLAEGWRAGRDKIKPWPAAGFKLLTPGVETYQVGIGAKVFTDRDYALNDVAPHLLGLTGMRFAHGHAKKGGEIKIDFEVNQPVKVLVGYFASDAKEWLQVPALEHVAHANDRGGIDPVLDDAAEIGDGKIKLPKVNVHAFRYDKGRHTLEMIGRGSYLILGVVPADAASRATTLRPTKPNEKWHEKNCSAWAYSSGNGNVSSKGFVELSKRLFEGPLRDATVRQ